VTGDSFIPKNSTTNHNVPGIALLTGFHLTTTTDPVLVGKVTTFHLFQQTEEVTGNLQVRIIVADDRVAHGRVDGDDDAIVALAVAVAVAVAFNVHVVRVPSIAPGFGCHGY
jgi:hypothetical protein